MDKKRFARGWFSHRISRYFQRSSRGSFVSFLNFEMHTPCDLDLREGAHSTVILAAWEMFIVMDVGMGMGMGIGHIFYRV